MAAEIPKSIIGWVVNQSKRDYWKVAGLLDLDDFIQDNLMTAVRCSNIYPDVEPKHLQALVKTAVARHIIILAKKRTELVNNEELTSDMSFLDRMMSVPESQLFAVLLSEMTAPVRAVLELFLDPIKVEALRKPIGDNETLNIRLCELVGTDPDLIDLPNLVRKHFK